MTSRSSEDLLDIAQAEMLKVGCPMAVKHNEVAPGQHEMSPVFRTANGSGLGTESFVFPLGLHDNKLHKESKGDMH